MPGPHLVAIFTRGYHIWGGAALQTEPAASYLVVVAASEEALFHYLQQRFEPDTTTRVILDRRRRREATATERRRVRTAQISSSQRVAVIRLTEAPGMRGPTVTDTAGTGGRVSMEGMEGLEDRQRVDRWLEESQYLIGRMIPAYLDDRDRVRGRLEASEKDNERLRGELSEARREIAELRAEVEFLRAERASVADSFTTIVEHLTALQKPVNEISRHLHSAQPVGVEAA
ncbi:MAG TPA: hypothetical protein VFL90_13050 [Methylomirabilota bacterium]|nr:hypothetical protein [Methylomirabilota bacterium]